MSLHELALVRRGYASERGLARRAAACEYAEGRAPRLVAETAA